MYGYEYGNARLHAMKSRLLSREGFRMLTAAEGLESLITALTHTAYRKAVEAALGRASGLEVIAFALSQDLIETARKIRRFFMGPEERSVAILLRAYDVHNLKTILRGLAHNASPDEITSALLPVGDLSEGTLVALAQASGPRAAIDLLATMRLPLARPLLTLRAIHPGADIPELETALDQWYFVDSDQQLRDAPAGSNYLLPALALDADMINLLTVIRLTWEPTARETLRQRPGGEDLRSLFVKPGRLPYEMLVNAADQPSLEAAIRLFAGTPYEEPLAAGLDAYRGSGRLSDLEKHLRHYRLCWRAQLIAKDPLGIGVLLGYLALKINEIANLRRVAYGINIRLKTAVIDDGLEFVT